MIYANVTLSIEDHLMKADKNIILYRGDKNVEIRFILKRNKFVVLENTYAQMIIKRPSARSIFSEPAFVRDNTVVFTITGEMIDELKEIGEYTFQIRLFDDNMVARATLPPCEGCLIIKRPIAVEGEALINVAMINDSAIMAATDIPAEAAHIPAPADIPAYDPWAENTPAVAADIPEEEIFDENNSYNRTLWVDGDIITDVRMNKIENALYQIKESAGNITITAPYISTFLPENIIVNGGDDFELDIEFRSQNLGNGTLKVFINDVDSLTQRIDQGITTTMVSGSLFTKGTNMVVVYVLDRAGVMTNSLTFYIRYGGLEITQTFDPYVAYDYGASVRYYFVPTSLDTSIPLTFYMEIDGVVQEGLSCVSDIRSSYDFPTNLPVGNHYCRAWISDGTNESNPLTFNLIILDSTSLVVASDTLNPSVEEGDQLSLDYRVYMKNNSSFITKTYVDDEFIGTGTCTLETAYYRTASLKEGVHTVRIEVYDVTERYSDFVVWNITITPSTYELLAPASAGSIFMASAYNKSNTDEDRQNWVGTNEAGDVIEAPLTNFAFNSENGWVDDTLIISGNSWVEVPVKPLANNAQYGFTLDIEFSTRPIGAEDAEVLTLWNDADNCGIKITTEQLIIRSKNGNQADLYFSEDEVVSAIFVIDRDEKTAKIYLNGVACEAFALSDYEAAGQKVLEDFTVNSNVYLGGYNKNGYCAIKNLRIYNIALSTNEILNNYMSNEKNKLVQKELVEFQKGNTLPTLTIYCDFSGLGKDDKKPCDIVYNSPDVNLYGESFRLDGKYSTLQYQGTSSMQYPIKNYRINPADANGKVKLDPFKTGVPESRFTLKADYMSSGHWQNTGLAKWVNDNLYNYKTNDPSTMNARKWYDLQNGGSLTDTRESIAGFPCRLILINDGNTTLTEGQQEPTPGNTKDMGIFNFNNDKDNVATMGLDTDIFPNSMSFEVAANSDTSAGAFVPYDGDKYIDCYLDGSGFYLSQAMSTSYFNTTSLTVTFDFDNPPGASRYRLRYYDANLNLATDSSYVDNGKTLTVNTSYPYFSFFLSDTTTAAWRGAQWKSITVNGVTYNCGETTRSLVKKDPYADFTKELEYLQASFELRHPDADDYGSDYGYLGLMAEEWIIKRQKGSDHLFTIPASFLNSDELVVDFYHDKYPNYTYVTYFNDGTSSTSYNTKCGTVHSLTNVKAVLIYGMNADIIYLNGVKYNVVDVDEARKEEAPTMGTVFSGEYGLKRVIDWVGNATDEQFVAEFDQYFHRDYTLRYYLLVIVLGMVDNLGKNMMLDTFDGKIWLPRFYDMDTICSYDNSGEIKFDVDIEMEQGYWNTSASRLWTKIRDLMHDELVLKYNDMRQNGMNFDSFMSYFYGQQISKIPQTYYNKDFDVKYAPYADEYMGKAHGDGYEHLKRWLKRRLTFTDTLFDYGPSYETDTLTIRANTLDLMSLEIETYTPVYQHVSFYNGNMEKIKINNGSSAVFQGYAQTATDQEVLIYGGSNIKKIKGLQTMNPNSMLLGKGTRITELDLSNCPILTIVNSNKANFSPHTYLNKLDISNCPQLGGTLNVSNSPLLQEINAMGTAVDNIQFNPSLRNLQTLRVPKNVPSLTLTDAGMLRTIEMEQGHNLQNLALTNCNNLTETINFDLTNIPTVSLDNSFNGQEVYMRDTTNLTLRNMTNLERVIFTPNSECDQFDINNVINGPNYKITTFNNPKMKDFITTAPHRLSYNKENYKQIIESEEKVLTTLDMTEDNGVNYTNGDDLGGAGFCRLPYTEVRKGDIIKVESTEMSGSDPSCWVVLYDKIKNYIGAIANGKGSGAYSSVTNGEIVVEKDGYMRIRMGDGDINGKIYYTTRGGIFNTKDITPNSVFTANTLDLADTQFENVKFLCTTDIYNLKVPTTMKNFYCDSAYDIDTDIVEDASYEVTHEELIEPYTTNYEGEITILRETISKKYSYDEGTMIQETLNSSTTTWMASTDYIPVIGGTKITITIPSTQNGYGLAWFDSSKKQTTLFNNQNEPTPNQVQTFTLPNEACYVRAQCNMGQYVHLTFTEKLVPNIIPSSASGSLIFNMYSNNTTKPTSTSPYMWDLTGLKLNDFYTYGMNNHVKADCFKYIDASKVRIVGTSSVNAGWTYWYPEHFCHGMGHSTLRSITPFYIPNCRTVTIRQPVEAPMVIMTTTNPNGTQSRNEIGSYEQSFNASSGFLYIALSCEKSLEYVDIIVDNATCYRLMLTEITAITGNLDYSAIVTFMQNIEDIQKGDMILVESSSITMPHRMPGYSVRMVNADITPDEYPTMFYPLLIDTGLPITGKLDYTKYKGTSLAWAYAYTTDDVEIDPLDSRYIGQITCDYNKLYSTDFIDIVDVWIYKDTDLASIGSNPNITKAFIELTSANYQNRVRDVVAKFPNCKDVHLFEDGTVTTLVSMMEVWNGDNNDVLQRVQTVTFMDGYFTKLRDLGRAFRHCHNLHTVNNIPNTVDGMSYTFEYAYAIAKLNIPTNLYKFYYTFAGGANVPVLDLTITETPNLQLMNYGFCICKAQEIRGLDKLDLSKVTDMSHAFRECSNLKTLPATLLNTLKSTVTSLTYTFFGCSALTNAPAIPTNITDMTATFYGCKALVQAPSLPPGLKGMGSTFRDCNSLEGDIVIPSEVTVFGYTFYGCKKLTSVDLSRCTQQLTGEIRSTFTECNNVTEIKGIEDLKIPANPELSFLDLFAGCSKLTSLDLRKWNVARFRYPGSPTGYGYGGMVERCTNLTNFDISTWDLSNVRDFGRVYMNTPNLNKYIIPVGTNNLYRVIAGLSDVDVEWVGELKRSVNFVPDSTIDDFYLDGTLSRESVRDLVNNHLADLGTPYLMSDGASYIDIPAEDMNYEQTTEIEVKTSGGYSGNIWMLGANGTYNMGRTDLNLFSSQFSAFFFGNGGSWFSIKHKDGEVIKMNTTGIYLDDQQMMAFEPFEDHRGDVLNCNYRIFGRAGYQEVVAPSGIKLYHVIFRNGNTVLHNFVPHIDEHNVVCIKDTVSNKLYYDNTGNAGITYGKTVLPENALTLNLGDTYGSYLTSDEIFAANMKGWTIVGGNHEFVIVNANMDVATLETDTTVTKCFIELTNENYLYRIRDVLSKYPNCNDVYFFDHNNVTSLYTMFYSTSNNNTVMNQIKHITFVNGCFDKLTNLQLAFYDMSNLETVSNIPKNVNTLRAAFEGCDKLTTIVGGLPTASNLNLYAAFRGTGLVVAPEIPQGATNMESTFENCSKLTQAPAIPSGVTTMRGCFYSCSKLTTPPTISNGVTNMENAFRSSGLTTAPVIPNSVTNMVSCFENCSALKQGANVPATVGATDSMYRNCTSLTSVVLPIQSSTCYLALAGTPDNISIDFIGTRTTDFSMAWIDDRSDSSSRIKQANVKDFVNYHLGNATGATLTLGSTFLSYLTQDEIAAAVAKGWTLQ